MHLALSEGNQRKEEEGLLTEVFQLDVFDGSGMVVSYRQTTKQTDQMSLM
jgi:hypothetical protein